MSETKATMQIELKPFQTPNFATASQAPGNREDGVRPSLSFPLKDLPVETLEKLCADFRDEVFRKAQKEPRS